METFIKPEINYSQKLMIQKEIKLLDTSENYELFKLIKKDTDKYTTNKNGAFINMKNLNNSTLWKILDFIKYCKTTKKSLEIDELKRRDLLEYNIKGNNDSIIEKKKEDCIINQNIDVNEYTEYNIEESKTISISEEAYNKPIKTPSLCVYKPNYIGVVGRILKKCREINKNETCVYGIYVNYNPYKKSLDKNGNEIIYEKNLINISDNLEDTDNLEELDDFIEIDVNDDSDDCDDSDAENNSDDYEDQDETQDNEEDTESFIQDCDNDNSDDDID
tara:strand:- start:1074 stop:1901 length:828 start_codon:yes stop_codon:yes gene_type:complete